MRNALLLAALLAAPQVQAGVSVKLTIIFPTMEDIGWINTASLKVGKKGKPISSPTWNGGLHTLTASYLSVPAGFVYNVNVGDGRSHRFVGRIDLRNPASNKVSKTIHAPPRKSVKNKGVVH
jgi:hypothetical protein